MPNEPAVPLPTVPALAPETADTLRVSPASMSLSLDRTLPDGLKPAVPLALPPASMAAATSMEATGASFVPLTVMTRLAVETAPWSSVTV